MEANQIVALVDREISADRLHKLIITHLPAGIAPFTVTDTGPRQGWRVMLIDLGENIAINMVYEIGYLIANINRDTYAYTEKKE